MHGTSFSETGIPCMFALLFLKGQGTAHHQEQEREGSLAIIKLDPALAGVCSIHLKASHIDFHG